MTWLGRLTYSKSLWAMLHEVEAGKLMFELVNYNMSKLEKGKRKIKNPVWSGIYNIFTKCRQNVLLHYPKESVSNSVCGKLRVPAPSQSGPGRRMVA